LTSRSIALATFLNLAKSKDDAEKKRLWLLLQALPKEFLSSDLLYTFSTTLCGAPEQYLTEVLNNYLAQLIDHGVKDLFTVIDEVQVATSMYPTSFSSRHSPRFRPVLSELFAIIGEVAGPIIISGTGLRKDEVDDNVTSASVKHSSIHCYKETGSFQVQEDQAAYITQFLWPGKQPEELPHEDKKLLRRAWQWLRGR
jgi:hypothetical protein